MSEIMVPGTLDNCEAANEASGLIAFSPVEYGRKRVLTTKQLAEGYEVSEDKIKQNFNNNESRYEAGKHYYCLQGDDLRTFKNEVENFDLVGKKASSLYLWTEKGALLHAKSLNTDNAWKVYDRLVETYFRSQEAVAAARLSPQLQALIGIELRQNEMEKQLATASAKVEAVESAISTIKDTIIQRDADWRSAINKMLNNAVQASGTGDYLAMRHDSYEILEQRAHCNLSVRLRNLRDRLSARGATKTQINSATKLDVIEETPQLKEIYTSIVKEFSIRYTPPAQGSWM